MFIPGAGPWYPIDDRPDPKGLRCTCGAMAFSSALIGSAYNAQNPILQGLVSGWREAPPAVGAIEPDAAGGAQLDLEEAAAQFPDVGTLPPAADGSEGGGEHVQVESPPREEFAASSLSLLRLGFRETFLLIQGKAFFSVLKVIRVASFLSIVIRSTSIATACSSLPMRSSWIHSDFGAALAMLIYLIIISPWAPPP